MGAMDLTLMTRPATTPAARPLAGKAAIVTGSTSGIGLGIAKALAEAGADVMLNGFGDATSISRVRDELEMEFGVTVAHSAADMSRPDEIEDMVAAAVGTLGAVDILVNNAGIQHVAPLESFPPAKWDQILSINLSAAFHTMRAVIPSMAARRWGRTVNIASAHGLIASPFKSAYVAAKHGLVGLTRSRRSSSPRPASPATPSVPATSGRLWSRSRSTTRPSRTASRASR
jgi:3-hydroxybutyrate dehydrogenase